MCNGKVLCVIFYFGYLYSKLSYFDHEKSKPPKYFRVYHILFDRALLGKISFYISLIKVQHVCFLLHIFVLISFCYLILVDYKSIQW